MIDNTKVNQLIQEEINKSNDSRVTKVLTRLQSRITDISENELNYMFEDWVSHEKRENERQKQLGDNLFKDFFNNF